MSADLWAAFGDDSQAGKKPQTDSFVPLEPAKSAAGEAHLPDLISTNAGTSDVWAGFESKPPPAAPIAAFSTQPNDLEDEWSAFEAADPIKPDINEIDTRWSASQATEKVAAPAQQDETTFDDSGVMWDADEALDSTASSGLGLKGVATSLPPSTNATSLVDISGLEISGQEGEDDEFGDFEEADSNQPVQDLKSAPVASTWERATVPATIMQNRIEVRGLGADELIFGATKKLDKATQRQQMGSGPNTFSHTSTAPASQANPFEKMSGREILRALPKKPLPQSPQPPTPVPKDEKAVESYFDEWDDFDSESIDSPYVDSPDPNANQATAATSTTPDVETSSIIPSQPVATQAVPVALPPSNVPPPSILLSHFANIVLPDLNIEVTRQQKSPNPTLRTAARILAGRKQRWKRDTHLAQSMSISASAPGLKAGMKLTALDRAEVAREDRDATEAVRVFRTKAGALRAAASRAGEKGVVELRENAPVRTEQGGNTTKEAKSGAAGGTNVAGPGKPCVVCGLRRTERVAAVDVQVFDGFGEWWIEHWGHRECKEWWEAEEGRLRGR